MASVAAGASSCVVCSSALPKDGRFMRCGECGNGYHLAGCSGIADRTFTTMGSIKREKWKCRACRSLVSCASPGTVTEASQEVQHELISQLEGIGHKLDVLFSLKASVEQLSQLPGKVDALLSLRPTVESMKETINSVQESVQFFSDKYDSLLALVTSHEKEVKALKAEVGRLQTTVSDQATSLEQLKVNLNDLEQYGRRQNMEIHGLPYSSTENLGDSLRDLAGRLDIAGFQSSDILAIHRLPARRDTVPAVIVRFVSVRAKEPWMASRGKLRSLPELGSSSKLYFNDNLTRANKELFWQARSRGRDNGFKFVWVKNGKIMAKKNEGSPVLRINSVHDLDAIA